MFPLPNVVYLLANEFSSLGGWRLPLTGISLCSLNSLALWHAALPRIIFDEVHIEYWIRINVTAIPGSL